MKQKLFRIIFIIAIMTVNIALDQVTKSMAVEGLKGQGTVQVVGDIFVLRYAENNGAFLSMGSDLPEPWNKILLTFIPALLLLGIMIYMFASSRLTRFQTICMASLIGGGFGNMYDRIFNNGLVVDFMNFGIGNIRTGILNVADLSITFGAILLFISTLIQERKEKLAAARADESSTKESPAQEDRNSTNP